jgi:hypothetical protein
MKTDVNEHMKRHGKDATLKHIDAAKEEPRKQQANGPDHSADKGQTERRIHFTKFGAIRLSTMTRYIVKGILPTSGIVVVWGPPKCGKSFWVFDVTAHVAAGWSYRGRRVKQCAVVYFALEGQLGFEARKEAFSKEHNVNDLPFYLSTDRIVLPRDGNAIITSIKQNFPDVTPGIVVLDTLNRSISGSENDPGDMGAYVRAADLIRETFGCLVIIIHHCGVEGQRPRGHTALTGADDAQVAVRRDDNKNIVATVEHMKDGPAGAEVVSFLEHITVGTDDDGEPITSCVVRDAAMEAAPKKSGPITKADRAFRELFNLINDGEIAKRPEDKHVPVAVTCVPHAKWKERLEKRHIINPEGNPRQEFQRIRVTLENDGRIGTWEKISWPVT